MTSFSPPAAFISGTIGSAAADDPVYSGAGSTHGARRSSGPPPPSYHQPHYTGISGVSGWRRGDAAPGDPRHGELVSVPLGQVGQYDTPHVMRMPVSCLKSLAGTGGAPRGPQAGAVDLGELLLLDGGWWDRLQGACKVLQTTLSLSACMACCLRRATRRACCWRPLEPRRAEAARRAPAAA